MSSQSPQLTLDDTTVVKAVEHHVACDLDGETVILDLNASYYYGLNPVGSRIWQLIQRPTAVGEIRRQLLAEFEVSEEQCRRDVLDLLQSMRASGLIETIDASAA